MSSEKLGLKLDLSRQAQRQILLTIFTVQLVTRFNNRNDEIISIIPSHDVLRCA